MRVTLALVSFMALIGGASGLAGAQPPVTAEQRIRILLETDLPRLYAGTDARAIAALWSDPATHGGMIEGRPPRSSHAEIEQLWSAGFAARAKDYSRRLRVSVNAVQILTADLASTDSVLTYTGGVRADGSANPDSKELLFAVLVRSGAGWKILASRVVPVPLG